jgi:hypothetical protein
VGVVVAKRLLWSCNGWLGVASASGCNVVMAFAIFDKGMMRLAEVMNPLTVFIPELLCPFLRSCDDKSHYAQVSSAAYRLTESIQSHGNMPF